MFELVKKLVLKTFTFTLSLLLKLRYHITIKGLENLNKDTLKKPGGVLFLPNHPAIFVDPAIIGLAIWDKYPIRPLVIDYVYDNTLVYPLMKSMNALRVPNFELSCNTLKKKKIEDEIDKVIEGLKTGDNFLIYPAGQLKDSNKEVIGGSSGVYRIAKTAPEANLVLVRIKGLFGSRFSRYFERETPSLGPIFKSIIWQLMKNFIFFTPKREVIVEFIAAPEEFSAEKNTRLEFNQYLEEWYNQPDGLTEQEGEFPGDSTILISSSLWGEKIPKRKEKEIACDSYDISTISDEVKEKVLVKLSEMSGRPKEKITEEMNLDIDVGLDSLDTSEIAAFLDDQFDIEHVPITELTTVGRLMGIASGQIKYQAKLIEVPIDEKLWFMERPRKKISIAEGETIAEVFLNNCERNKNFPACGDLTIGCMSYKELKLRTLIIADYVSKLPGEYIGIFLPSTSAAFLCILACEIAGKTPLPINWTIGPKHLQSVAESSKVEAILSSWTFLDRLSNVDLSPIQDKILMLEDIRKKLTLFDKLKGLYRSKLSTTSLLKLFGANKKNGDDTAVLLFTSGTESLPKGVPLTHKNILSNLQGAFEALDLYGDDIIYDILPPFHSFGFCVCGLSGLLSGMRVAFFPDPNDGKNLANGVEKWGITIFCGAPTFVKKMLQSSKAEQLKSLRLTVCGAEKTPPVIFDLLSERGIRDTYAEGYGITECSPILSANMSGHPQYGVGKPIPSVELLIVSETSFEPLPQGKRGMILATGPNIFPGYINPGLESPFIELLDKRWYKTGDLGYLDEEGNLIISGRLKRFVKTGGEMISLPAIEETLSQMASEKKWKVPVKEGEEEYDGPLIAVSAKECANEKTEIILFTLFAVERDEVNEYLRNAGFSNIAKIGRVIHLEEIPILGSGKINYRFLESEYIN